MDIVDDLKNLQDALLTQGAMMCVSDVSVAITEITRLRELHSVTHHKMLVYEAERDKLREQLALSQAECIALQNKIAELEDALDGWKEAAL